MTNSIIEIRFNKAKSQNYARAETLAKSFSNCYITENDVFCSIDETRDFCRLQKNIYELIQIVKKWKGTVIKQSGKECEGGYGLTLLVNGFGRLFNKRSYNKNDHHLEVAFNDISYEDLPLPVVYYPDLYGAFFGFSEDFDTPIKFCECEREAIENYIKLRAQQAFTNNNGSKTNPLGTDCFPKIMSVQSIGLDNPLSCFEFKESICFRCNQKVPLLKYCHPMYGGVFKQNFGWYIQQEYLRLGIDRYQIKNLNVLTEKCPPEIYDSLCKLSGLINSENGTYSPERQKKAREIKAQIEQTIENSVRIQLGYKQIGDQWVSETILSEIVKQLFPADKIIRHYRPKWLEGLELDVFVEQKNIAFEYQGIQHFQPVDHWGGEEQLSVQKEHDKRKKNICKEQGVRLICINYFDPLTYEFVSSKLKNK